LTLRSETLALVLAARLSRGAQFYSLGNAIGSHYISLTLSAMLQSHRRQELRMRDFYFPNPVDQQSL
jgi:hypothetical protein